MSSVIEVENLTKTYRKSKTPAVDSISLTVEKGAFFALLGPNGAGKTTTLSILNTNLSKTSGTVRVAGYDIDKDQSKVRENIGVIFQNPSLDLNLTAEENIRFHANLYGIYPFRPSFKSMPSEYQMRVKQLAGILGLDFESLLKPVKNLSGGMKRKLEIIRGLMHNPKVLFLDEPTTGLDPLSRKNLWAYLQEIRHKEQITIFLTTHYLEEAEGADFICIINNGKIVEQGSPAQIKRRLIDEYLIIDAEDRNSLKKNLEEKNIKYTGSGPYIVDVNDENSAQSLIQKIDVELKTLKLHSPTLEEAYIDIVGSKEE